MVLESVVHSLFKIEQVVNVVADRTVILEKLVVFKQIVYVKLIYAIQEIVDFYRGAVA